MVDFFIHRPVFSTVCALMIILAGAVCIPTLPISQFPSLAPPQVQVDAVYTGASAEVVEQSRDATTTYERDLLRLLTLVIHSPGRAAATRVVAYPFPRSAGGV